jgi:hypothetical protein
MSDFQAFEDMEPEDKKAVIAKQQNSRKSARRSDLAGIYAREVATLLRTLNNLEALESSIAAAGAPADEDLIGENAYMTGDQFASGRTTISNLITVLREGGSVAAFSRDALESIVQGGATI